jgi:N-acetyl-1-D-myo-inositol-2-amino-2-deoxy-alpha-D-glucopyranoside deacetylase
MAGRFLGRSLLAVFAHPDDESLACGGLLAWCADEGMHITLMCATRGEDGRDHLPEGSVEPLADRRIRELASAADVLGIDDIKVLDFEDGMLPWVEGDDLQRRISGQVGRLNPDVVLTFDEDGLYWHPDHIAIHRATRAAVASAGTGGPALYYASVPEGQMRQLVDAVKGRLPAGADTSILGVEDVDAIGTLAPPATLVLDVGRFAPRKLAALMCHATQTSGGPFSVMTEGDAVRYLGVEQFRRAHVGNTDEPILEQLHSAV